jgi:glycosyltransferase involved in cell wall biosynthesis
MWKENGGPVAALLAGAEHASSDVVVNLDDDVIPRPGLFEGHLRHHQARPRLVVAGYAAVAPRRWRPGGFIYESFRQNYEEQCERWERDPSTVLTQLWAPNVSFRRADLLRVIAENPPVLGPGSWYHSDWDLGLRCRSVGMSGVFDRALVADHEFERSFAGFVSDARSSGRGEVVMEREHPELVGLGHYRRERERRPIRLMLGLAGRSDRLARAMAGTLGGLIRLAGALRSRRAEATLASLLKRLEQERGRLEAIREQAPLPTAAETAGARR